MNLAITTNCNKGCPYCFASQKRSETIDDNQTMSLETFKKMLDKIEGGHVKLIGGEPTMHPQFNEFLDEIVSRGMGVTVISNFLFGEKVREKLIEVSTKTRLGFLINATNLDERGLIKKWAKNYNALYYHFYKMDAEEKLSCGITFENDKDWKYYVNYIDFLLKHVPTIERLRMSLPFPGDREEKENFFFINNHDLGEKFLTVTKKAMDNGATPSIDCVIYPCMFKNKEEFKFVRKFAQNFKSVCSGIPADVFPNGEVIHCYPLKDSITLDSNKYKDFNKVLDVMSGDYTRHKSNIYLPAECKKCRHLHKGCDGPCLGFYKPETIKRAI